ncbi:zinc finger HIT domain-containing protein 2 [Bufo bufo]|uniref:zinc finger HIT domain-containing protein 2 n=1 Tax=Bufo bufo TaxID=8384 RepID=UPI001ABDCFB9|nr:zinc finger HIT domain-containing protein 2 [Bufo bufo]
MEALEPEIVLPGRSTRNEDGGAGPAVCALCLSAPAKYTCPRCNVPYCSLPCYKGARHSDCSELFYRDSVLQALGAEEPGSRGRKQVEEMLLKLREEEEQQEEEEESSLWSSLSCQEKEHFSNLIKSGHIASLVPQWRPWWDTPEQSQRCKIMMLRHGDPLPTSGQEHGTQQQAYPAHSDTPGMKPSQSSEENNQEVPEEARSPPEKTEMASHMVNGRKDSEDCFPTENLSNEGSAKHGHHRSASREDRVKESETLGRDPSVDDTSVVSEVPPLLHSIPPLCSLTRKSSPLVRFAVVNVVYSYSFSLLRHNGDLSDDDIMLDFIGTLLSVSGALSTTTVYQSTAHALKSAVRAASDPLLGGDEGVAVLAMEATGKILVGDDSKRYSLAALSHLYHLLGKVRKLGTEEKDVRKGAFNAKKKCLFLAAWVNENGERLGELSAEVMMEYYQHLKEVKEVEEISKGLQRVWSGKRPPAKKKLIEEVE